MAYDIIGTVHKIGTTEQIQTRNGNPFQRRSITLIQQRYDQNTGQPFEPNYPTIEFAQNGCAELDKFKPGDKVRIRFDLSGREYEDKNTHEKKYMTSLKGFRIEPYAQPAQQPIQQPQAQYPQQPHNYAQAGQWQQPAPQEYAQQPQGYPQSGGYQQTAPQQSDLPFI